MILSLLDQFFVRNTNMAPERVLMEYYLRKTASKIGARIMTSTAVPKLSGQTCKVKANVSNEEFEKKYSQRIFEDGDGVSKALYIRK